MGGTFFSHEIVPNLYINCSNKSWRSCKAPWCDMTALQPGSRMILSADCEAVILRCVSPLCAAQGFTPMVQAKCHASCSAPRLELMKLE